MLIDANITQSRTQSRELPYSSITSDMAREVGRVDFWIPLELFFVSQSCGIFLHQVRG